MTETKFREFLMGMNKDFTFPLNDELPTAEDNLIWLNKYESEIGSARSDYWQVLKDIQARKALAPILDAADKLKAEGKPLPDEKMLYTLRGANLAEFSANFREYATSN